MANGNGAVAASIAQKIGQPTQTGGDTMAQQPGERTDSLVGALRALQMYSKMATETDPNDPDAKLVRKIIVTLAQLLSKDQQEAQGDVGTQGIPQSPDQGMMGGGMGGGDVMAGAPQQPDLSSILGR